MAKQKIVLKLKRLTIEEPFDEMKLSLPSIFKNLNHCKWEELSENLAIETLDTNNLTGLEHLFNKKFYNDQYNTFKKSFDIKTRNLYDLSLTPINRINDAELVVDEYGFCFSYYDLRKIPANAYHPYNKLILFNQARVSKKPISITNYFTRCMIGLNNSKHSNHSLLCDITDSDPNDIEQLVTAFESIICHDFFTTNLITIYQSKPDHLDYTVGIIYYILGIIDDYKEKYEELLKDNYCRSDDKYKTFLKSYIDFLKEIHKTNNIEKYHYICIIIFKILQYRYNIISDGEELYTLVKNEFKPSYHDELYWSIIQDRTNFYYQQKTNKINLMNINIDNIFTNCELPEYFYTLMFYLHSKYMHSNIQENMETATILNHYKSPENYSYLDLLKYFMDLHHEIQENAIPDGNKYLYRQMIKRYYLKPNPICITRTGLICD